MPAAGALNRTHLTHYVLQLLRLRVTNILSVLDPRNQNIRTVPQFPWRLQVGALE